MALSSVLAWAFSALANGGLDTFIRPLTAEESAIFHNPGLNVMVAGETAKLATGAWIEAFVLGLGVVFVAALALGLFFMRDLIRRTKWSSR